MNVRVQYCLHIKNESITFYSEWVNHARILPILTNFKNKSNITQIVIEDEMNQKWTLKEYEKYVTEIDEFPSDISIYFDGSFHKADMSAGIGMVVYYYLNQQQYRIRSNSYIDKLSSNNEAEYIALYQSLLLVEEIGAKSIPCTVNGDAQGVLKQLAGEWPCYDDTLNKWLDKIETLIDRLHLKIETNVIGREKNKEADQLARQALNAQSVHSHVKIQLKKEE